MFDDSLDLSGIAVEVPDETLSVWELNEPEASHAIPNEEYFGHMIFLKEIVDNPELLDVLPLSINE